MVTIGKYNGDLNCWGLSHNDFHRVAMQVPENIDVQLNSTDNNAPLVLKAGSGFYVWGSSGITISANSSGNVSYPAGSTYDYFRPSAVYTTTDFAPVWDSTAISTTGGNGTYYMICKGGVDSTAVGQGQIDYLNSSFTPAYSASMSGWYGTTAGSTEWRALARFIMTSNVMSRAVVFRSRLTDPGYVSNINVFSTGTNVYLSPLTVDLGGGKAVQYLQEISLAAIATLTASTWYSVCVSESDGTITNSSNAGSFSDWTITGNQLNAYSIYNSDKNYCRATISSTVHRVLDIYVTSSGSSRIDINKEIRNEPKTMVFLTSTASQSIPAGSVTAYPTYNQVIIDLNSEMSIATTYIFTASKSKLVKASLNYVANFSSYAIGNSLFAWFKVSSTSENFSKFAALYTVPTASTAVRYTVTLNETIPLQKGDTLTPAIAQGSSNTVTTLASSAYQWLEIIEV